MEKMMLTVCLPSLMDLITPVVPSQTPEITVTVSPTLCFLTSEMNSVVEVTVLPSIETLRFQMSTLHEDIIVDIAETICLILSVRQIKLNFKFLFLKWKLQ